MKGNWVSGGEGGRQRAERTCLVEGKLPPIPLPGRGEPCPPCSSSAAQISVPIAHGIDFLLVTSCQPRRTGAGWLLLYYIAGHPRLLLSSQGGKHLLRTSAREGITRVNPADPEDSTKLDHRVGEMRPGERWGRGGGWRVGRAWVGIPFQPQ